jgi:hypothetical protein
MNSFLADQLEQFGQSVCSPTEESGETSSAQTVSEMVATAIYLLDRIEKTEAKAHLPRPQWDENTARNSVPLFRKWFEHATAVAERVRDCARRGEGVEGANEFLHRYNAAKMMAVDFERTAAAFRPSNGQIHAGRQAVPLDEVMNELLRRGGPAGN